MNCRKLKILQVSDNYSIVGGAETYFRAVVDLLKENEMDVAIAAFDAKEKITKKLCLLEEPKTTVGKLWARFVFNYSAYRKLRTFIKTFKPDVIHFHKIDNKQVNTFLLACRGLPIIYTVHDCGQICITGWCTYKDTLTPCSGYYGLKCVNRKCIPWYWLPPFYLTFKLRDYLTKKYVTQYLCPSSMLTKRMQEHKYSLVKQFPYHITTQKAEFVVKYPNTFVFVGRLSEEKGIMYLLEGFNKAYKKNNAVRLLIVGGGPAQKELETYVKHNKLEKVVTFTGKIPYKDMHTIFTDYSLFVVPSIWQENYPLTILDALSYGKVIIGSNIGGIPDMVQPEKTGFLVPPKNAGAIAKTILNIAGDSNHIIELGKAAKAFGDERHDPQNHFKRLHAIYLESIEEKED